MVITNENYIKNNPMNDTDTCIIITSHGGHRVFLKYALSQYMKTKKYCILSYDRHNDIPSDDILNIPHSVVFKHQTWGAEKRIGWLFDIVYASGLISLYNNIRYVVTVNGDTIYDKPNNINKLISLLGNNDIMSASSEPNLIHTCNVIWKRECFLDFIKYIQKKLEVNIPEGYSPEILLRDFIQWRKYKVKHVDKQPRYPVGHFYEGKIDHYSSYYQKSTFMVEIGYRNLGAEHKQACLEHLEPVNVNYLDLRNDGEYFSKHEKDTLYKYYITGDRRHLYRYWDTGEDSWFNRRYLTLGFYGPVSLFDDSKRSQFGPYSERTGFFDRCKYNSYIIKDKEYEEKWKKIIEEKGYDNE